MWFKEKARRRRAETRRLRELDGLAKAMDRAQPVVEFRPNATIIRANTPFLGLTGYASSELVGGPHSLFLTEGEVDGAGYREFWKALRRGETITKLMQLVGKDGGAIRVQAAYSPVIDTAGKVSRIAMFVTDVSDLRIEVVRPAPAPARVQERAPEPVQERAQERADEQDQVIAVLSEQFKALAAGDLSTRVNAVFGERYGHVRDEFNIAIANLGQMMNAISVAAGGLGESSDAVARVSQTLSRDAGRQASDLQRARTALRKMTSTAGRGAESLRRVTEVAAGMRIDAGGSRRAVREAGVAMAEIEQSAVRINQAITLVDEVVAQANLLSLVAEVEVARTSDEGRSFQVVTQKMRGLAERAIDAAREIKGVAAANTAQVARGARLMDDARASCDGMTSRIAQIDGLVAGLAKTAQEQALDLQAIGDAVGRADDAAQTQAERVDEAAAVTGRLIGDAEGLMQAASPFRANVTSRPASRPEPARAGRHAPAGNAVAHAHARIAAYASPG
jgi:methyl-accepting chemotaxis protein